MAVFPGSVKRLKRTIWALDDVRILDGGGDGDGDTTADNTVFARPGVFIPSCPRGPTPGWLLSVTHTVLESNHLPGAGAVRLLLVGH